MVFLNSCFQVIGRRKRSKILHRRRCRRRQTSEAMPTARATSRSTQRGRPAQPGAGNGAESFRPDVVPADRPVPCKEEAQRKR